MTNGSFRISNQEDRLDAQHREEGPQEQQTKWVWGLGGWIRQKDRDWGSPSLKLLYVLLAFVYSSVLIHKTAFFHDFLLLSHESSAYLYSLIAAIQTVGSFVWSYVADRSRRSKLLLLISAFLNCSVFLLFLLMPGVSDSRQRNALQISLIALWTFSYSGLVSLFDAVIVKRLVAVGKGREAVSRQKLWGSISSGILLMI